MKVLRPALLSQLKYFLNFPVIASEAKQNSKQQAAI